ncbi:MAG: MFS transporter [Gammaproteobacteria bacterium]|nr:MFS transporter [Gammaproteobacteria bacterium]
MDPFTKIKWLYLARLASLIGSQILFFAVPLLIYRLTHNVFYSGLAFSLEWSARLISFPLSGYCADRFGSKKVYVLTDMIIGVLCLFAIILVSLFHSISVFVFISLSIMAGFLSEQGYVSAESLAPKLVEVKFYPRSQSILEMLELLAMLLGPCLAGLFVSYFNLENLITVAAVFYFLSAIAMKKIQIEICPIQSSKHFFHNISVGFNTVLQNTYLFQLVLLAILMNILYGLMLGAAPIMVAGIYHKTDHFYALLNLAAGIGGATMIVLFNYILKFVPIAKIGAYTFFLSCLSCIGLRFTHNYFSYLLVFAFYYSMMSLFSIFFRSERVRIIPHEILGRAIGTIIFITFLLFPLSGLLISFSQQFLGLQNLFMVLGILCLFCGMPLLKNIYSSDGESRSNVCDLLN